LKRQVAELYSNCSIVRSSPEKPHLCLCRVDLVPPMSARLRQLATSAAAGCNASMSTHLVDILTDIVSSAISAHYETCLNTTEKIVKAKFKYDVNMCSKPQVSYFVVFIA